MPLGPNIFIISALIGVIVGANGCGRSTPSDTPIPLSPSSTPVNPQALLQQSGRVMGSLNSFHFRLEHESGTTILTPSLAIDKAEGDVVSPDKIFTKFSGTVGGFPLKASLITLADSSYMTNFLSGKWETVPPDVSPLGFFDPRRGITAIMSQVDQLSLLPDGKGVYRLRGTLPAEALAPLVGDTVTGAAVAVELTVQREDLYLLKAVIDGRVTPNEPDGTVRLIILSRFNEAVTIEPPL